MNNLRSSVVIVSLALIVLALCPSCQVGAKSKADKQWGRACEGLRIRIDVENKADEKHDVVLFFQNVSKHKLRIWNSGFWPNTMLQCYTDEGTSAEPTSEGRRWLNIFKPGGERSFNILVKLNPGQIYESRTLELERVYELIPSEEYQVRVIYEEHFEMGWSGAVTSNVVRVKK